MHVMWWHKILHFFENFFFNIFERLKNTKNVRTFFKVVKHTKKLLYGSFRIILFTFYPFYYMNKQRIEGKSLPKLSLTCFMLLEIFFLLSFTSVMLVEQFDKGSFLFVLWSRFFLSLSLNWICIFFVAFSPSFSIQ